ncbi:YeiH family protein [Halorarum salinum]|uniref:Putative sulfate exporter family transporter n=1 Tax=Halorarum salinum TaxID=2743089 RepID=A0A7D5LE42_9EURY|nr:putative sulfate exporter family transporter [Halobaculum salinum]QLG63849.1 putative sulfate exporter family transporter [Halobaculum salinum]
MSLGTRLRRSLPGLAVLLVLGAVARPLAALSPSVSELLVAVALGALVANTVGVPARLEPGVGGHTRLLEAGIVLMGATVALGAVLEAGPAVLGLVVAVVASTVLVVELLSRAVFGLDRELGSLLAAGSGVCGVSAVVAVAGGIRPDEEHVAYAVGTVLLFDAVTLFAYPVVGALLAVPDVAFGIWAGLTMFSTGPVVAAGFEYSRVAGQWATITKLTRNLLIGVVVVAYSAYYVRRRGSAADAVGSVRLLWREFPTFVLGFVAVVLLANAGVPGERGTEAMDAASGWCFLLAFVGLGLRIRLEELLRTGVRPALTVLVAFGLVSTTTLAVVLWLFPA